MPKQPLFPHIPGKKEPLFPHVPKGKELGIKTIDARDMHFATIAKINQAYPAHLFRQISVSYSHDTTEQDIREFRERAIREGAVVMVIQEYGQYAYVPLEKPAGMLPQTPPEIKHYWVEKNLPYDTWAIVEAFPGGTVRSPFDSKQQAIEREEGVGQYYEWNLKLVPSPQEKFPKQHEVLKGFYPYEIIEYHDNGDLTIQSLEPLPRPKVGFKKGYIFVVTTDGKIFKQERLSATTETLPFTIKEPLLLPAVAEGGTYAWLIIDPETGEIMIKPGYATVDKAKRSVRDFAVRRAKYEGQHPVEVRIYDRDPDIDDLASGIIFKGELRLPEGAIVEEPSSHVLEQLTKEVCYDFRAVRSVVMKHAWELMEKERQPFRTAIKKAWEDVKRQCLKLGAII